jgi:NTP pyrophosphatase (non-canonical NTP hydrolase)
MSDIKKLQKRALQIAEKYDEISYKKRGEAQTVEDLALGFAGDMGDLMKLVMAKKGVREIEDVDKKLAHELADCLWTILVLARKLDIDIEKAFLDTMYELDLRLKGIKK